uniref:PAS domain S-box protein n=1 Tax=Gracilibacillus dipsosauri TaxID=178340 RepID=UPI00240A5A33
MGTIRYAKQVDIASEGMFYRFVKKGDTFVHTDIGGKLFFEFGFTPDMIIGKTLFEFFPEDYAKLKHELYVKAWEGNFIQYESRVKGIYYVASLRPIFAGDKVIEVEASCIDVTERINRNRQLLE